MLNQSVARRYAEALYEIAQEQNQIDGYQAQLKLVVDSLAEVPAFRDYFHNFLVPVEEKKEILQKIFADDVTVPVLHFLFLLVDKRRENILETIYTEYIAMADEHRNIKKAELYTAVALSDEDLKALAENLGQATGKTIQLNPHVDPSLLGGVMLRIEDKIVDATIKKRLQLLQADMKNEISK